LRRRFKEVVKKILHFLHANNCKAEDIQKLLVNSSQLVDGSKEGDGAVEYKENPVFFKYRFHSFIISYVVILIYVYLPAVGNQKLVGKYFCASLYATEPFSSSQKCNFISDNLSLKMFFIMQLVYLLLSAL
jgi:hypothetical protein